MMYKPFLVNIALYIRGIYVDSGYILSIGHT